MSKYIYMDGFQHWLNRIVKWRFEVFLTEEYDCKHGGGKSQKRPRFVWVYNIFSFRVNLVFWSLSERRIDQNLLKPSFMAGFNSCAALRCVFFFFFCTLLLLNIKVLFCDVRLGIRELVTTDTCEMQWEVRLEASVDTTYAAGLLVAALLFSAYLLNDWPSHVLNKHAFQLYIWRPVQHPHLWSDQCPVFVERYLLHL